MLPFHATDRFSKPELKKQRVTRKLFLRSSKLGLAIPRFRSGQLCVYSLHLEPASGPARQLSSNVPCFKNSEVTITSTQPDPYRCKLFSCQTSTGNLVVLAPSCIVYHPFEKSATACWYSPLAKSI